MLPRLVLLKKNPIENFENSLFLYFEILTKTIYFHIIESEKRAFDKEIDNSNYRKFLVKKPSLPTKLVNNYKKEDESTSYFELELFKVELALN